MNQEIHKLSLEELKNLIKDAVEEAIDDRLENIEAMSSKEYLDSIKESREQFK